MGRKEIFMATTEPIRDLNQLKMLADYFLSRKKYRDYTMIVLGVYTILRISDLLQLRWSHVSDESGRIYSHINTIERKTGKPKLIALNDKAVKALQLLYPHRRSAYIFASRNGKCDPITRVHLWRLITDAVKELGLEGVISCHSLRKTLGYHMYKNDVSPIILMEIYNHSNFDVTKRYIGVTQDEIDKAYTELNLF